MYKTEPMALTDAEQIQWLSDAYEDCKVRLWEAKSQINNKGILLQIEVERDRGKKKDQQIKEMADQIESLKKKLAERIPDSGGSWVSQSAHMRVCEKLKEAIRDKDMAYKAVKDQS